MNRLVQDIRYGLRVLRHQSGFTAAAVLALALGIGANSAIFTVVHSMLLRPLQFPESDKLLQLWETSLKKTHNPVSYPNFLDWRERSGSLQQLAAFADWQFNLTGQNEAERIHGSIVTASFFSTLGVRPMLGRDFLPDEDKKGKELAVLLSERLWERRFGSDPQIVGKPVTLNGKAFTIIGVIPRLAQVPVQESEIECWAPVSQGFALSNRDGHYLSVIGRLTPGFTAEQARAEMDGIARQLADQYPASNTDRGLLLVGLHEQVVGDFRTSLLVLLCAVIFVLLIASANVANMLLARATSRRKEMAIRSALGASRSRIVRQLLTESIILALMGGAVGFLLALWGIEALTKLAPPDLPRLEEIRIDGWILGFTLLVSLITGALFGLVPAFQGSRGDLNETLKEGGRSSRGGGSGNRTRGLLVVCEVALSIILLAGAGLLIRSFANLQSVDPGFNPENLLTMQLTLSGSKYRTADPVVAFQDQLLEKIEAVPGVQSVATRSFVPLVANDFAKLSFLVEGTPGNPADMPLALFNAISPNYFRTMQTALLRGRDFTLGDNAKSPNVVIVNDTFARRYFGDRDPLGKRITLNDENPSESDWSTIVGVVSDTKALNLSDEDTAEMYMPFAQQPQSQVSLMIRTASAPLPIASSVRNVVLSMDPDQPVYSVKTLKDVASESVASPRFRTLLLGLFAGTALLMALVGIYGVMAYSVSQRTHEIGIRLALGARRGDILRMVVGQGLLLSAAGVLLGIAGALAVTRLMSSMLFGVNAADPLVFAVIPAVLVATALVACYLPARRAMRIDPMAALRQE